jgi:glycogen(starch) synthase
MKILHLIYDDMNNPWLGGGGALQTLEVSKLLASKEYEITVVTGNYPKAIMQESINGVLYKRVGYSRSYFLSRLTYCMCTPRLIRSLDYDILVDDFSAYSPTFSPLYSKKPVIAVIRNSFDKHAFKKYKFIGLAVSFNVRICIRLYSNLQTVSKAVEEQLRKIVADRTIKYIPDCVDESLFLLESSEESYILFIGRIDIYQKGLDTLLKAFSLLEGNNLKLVIAGGGKDINRLQRMISKLGLSDRVILKGYVRGQEKKDLLSKCLFVCMPSRFEAFGGVAMEAAACAKAIIGTDIPGLSEPIKDGETGILVEPDNPVALSQTMLRLLEDKDLRKKLGQAGREWARNFTLDRTVRLTEEFLLKCFAGAYNNTGEKKRNG